ncbi:MAG: PIN domain-containing protein [Blastocatellia bacterium]|nr:PIN domain-containing protein [Blastocatellia bacterium]
MIVYVESNFVLESAYLQEEHESCEEILKLAEEGRIGLVLPAYSVGEPYDSWVRRSKQRAELHERLLRELNELSRSKPYVEMLDEFQGITKTLVQSGGEEKERLDNAVSRILEKAVVVPIEREVIKAAIDFQKTRNLSPQDSIVYASVLSHLSSSSTEEPKCFITKNSKDFANPDIYTELESYGCKLLTKFNNGLGYAKSCI